MQARARMVGACRPGPEDVGWPAQGPRKMVGGRRRPARMVGWPAAGSRMVGGPPRPGPERGWPAKGSSSMGPWDRGENAKTPIQDPRHKAKTSKTF